MTTEGKEIVSSYPTHCSGVSADRLAPLMHKEQVVVLLSGERKRIPDNNANPTVTYFKDGSRATTCQFLDTSNGLCRAPEELFPNDKLKRCALLSQREVEGIEHNAQELQNV